MSKADKAVLERRLRPIYDAIDADNTKKAIQEADKILKKHPNTVCAKVLKGLALIRGERLSEAFAIIDALDVPGAQYDDTTLQAFCHCFKEAALPKRICQLYERVITYAPTEHNLTHLFMAYARTKQYKNQQQIAMRLFKEFNNGPYFFWSVMSIVMQAVSNPDLGKKMFYPLADKMVQAHVQKHGYKAGAEVELHAMVLEGLGHFAEADKLLGTEPTKSMLAMPPHFTSTRRMNLLIKGKSYRLAVDRAIESLKEKNQDDWALWTALFDAVFEIVKDEETPEEKKKAVLDEVSDTVVDFCSVQGKLRGPYLARFELIVRLLKAEEPIRSILGTKLGDPLDLLLDYVRRFYAKPCCYVDIAQYLFLLSPEKSEIFYLELEKFVAEVTVEGPDSDSESMCRAIIVFERLRRRMGILDRMTSEDRKGVAQNLILAMMHPSRTDLSGADLAQLAAAILWNEWKVNDDWTSFYEMLVVLEWTALRFKVDPFCKLVLCRAYAQTGVLHRMIALAKALDIKSVQRDTLGHILFPMYEVCGRFNLGLVHYTELADMYSQAEREITDCVANGYKNGAFSQIPGLIELYDKMDKSALAVGGDVMSRYLSGLFVIHNVDEAVNTLHGDEEPIDWNSLVDNRDVTVVATFEPGQVADDIAKTKEATQSEFIDITQLRHVLSRCIAAVGRGGSAAQLKDAATKFRVHFEYCCTQYAADKKPSTLVQSCSPVRLSEWVHRGGLRVVARLVEAAVTAANAAEQGGSDPDVASLPSEEELKNSLRAVLPPVTTSTAPFHLHDVICDASRVLQSLAACQLLLILIDRRVGKKAAATPSGKGKAKEVKKSPFFSHCSSLLSVIDGVAGEMHQVIDQLMMRLAQPGTGLIPEVGHSWKPEVRDILVAQAGPVHDRIIKSYAAALEDMLTTIDNLFPSQRK